MPTNTYTTPGTNNVAILGKRNFTGSVISTGGKGATSDQQDAGGGGGGGYAAFTINDADLAGGTNVVAFLPNPDTESGSDTSVTLDGSNGLKLSAGGLGGDTTGGAGGSAYVDNFSWATATHTGGTGGTHAAGGGTSSGSGGGSSGGTSAAGNNGAAGDIIGVAGGAGGAAVTGGGAGGAGGALHVVGTNGSSPGGGGGGGGDLAANTAAFGGNAKIVLNYDTVSAPVITSNGGGATAAISKIENSLALITTVTASNTYADTQYFVSGTDSAAFSVGLFDGQLAWNEGFFVSGAPDYEHPLDTNGDNTYIVIVTVVNYDAAQNEFTDTQTITVTVTNDSSDDGRRSSPMFQGLGLTIYG